MAERGIKPPATEQKPREPRTETIECEFAGLHLLIEPNVYDPNPASAAAVTALIRETADIPQPTIVDVGTGSGAIALAYALRRPDARVYALDISAAAVACARANAQRLGALNVQVLEGALLDPLAAERRALDGVVANIPWVAPAIVRVAELEKFDRWRGPRETVVGADRDGLGLQRALLHQAAPLLKPGGFLLFELDTWQIELLSAECAADYEVTADGGGDFIILRPRAAESPPPP